MAALYLEIMPRSFQAIQALTTRVHADFIANFARPGAFTQLEAGFIFHYRERANDGSLRGVFIQDRRDPAAISTYIAEVGEIVEKDGDTYLLLLKGSTQRPRASGDSAIITFDDYAIDLSQFIRKGDAIRRPRERNTWQLLAPDPHDPGGRQLARQSRAELFDRLTSPLYAFAAGLIGFAALGEARTTRQGRGWRSSPPFWCSRPSDCFGITDVAADARQGRRARRRSGSSISVWAIPLFACAASLDAIFGGPLARGLQTVRARRGKRGGAAMIVGVLDRYFGRSFLKTVLAVFGGVFFLIFTIDLVETLRNRATGPVEQTYRTLNCSAGSTALDDVAQGSVLLAVRRVAQGPLPDTECRRPGRRGRG